MSLHPSLPSSQSGRRRSRTVTSWARTGVGPLSVRGRRPSWAPPTRDVGQYLAGLIGIAVGVAMILASELGAAPWDVLNTGLAGWLGVPLAIVMWAVGATILVAGWLLGARPAWGTGATIALCGPMVWAATELLPDAQGALGAWLLLSAGVVVLAVGAGAYLTAGCGVGPLDMVFVELERRGLPIVAVRLVMDGAALAVGWALGGAVGPGTLVITVAAPVLIPAATRLVARLEARDVTSPDPLAIAA